MGCYIPNNSLSKGVCKKLHRWNREEFHNIFRKNKELWARIEGVQCKLSASWDRGLIKLERKFQRELEDVLHEDEMLWLQKSRLEAIKDGDRNTKFFHLSTVIRRNHNRIEMLPDNTGRWISNTEAVKGMVVDYWKGLFTEEFPNYPGNNFRPNYFPVLSKKELDTTQSTVREL